MRGTVQHILLQVNYVQHNYNNYNRQIHVACEKNHFFFWLIKKGFKMSCITLQILQIKNTKVIKNQLTNTIQIRHMRYNTIR